MKRVLPNTGVTPILLLGLSACLFTGCQIHIEPLSLKDALPAGPFARATGSSHATATANQTTAVPTNGSRQDPATGQRGTPGVGLLVAPSARPSESVEQAAFQQIDPSALPTGSSQTLAPPMMPPQGNAAVITNPWPGTTPWQGAAAGPESAWAQRQPTATEMVVELRGEVLQLRQDLLSMRSRLEQVSADNDELRYDKQQLERRIAEIEVELHTARQNELAARQDLDRLSLRLEEFTERKQSQLKELNRLIDQLEAQMNDSPPTTGRIVPNPFRENSFARAD